MFVNDRGRDLLFRSRQLEAIAWCSERLRTNDPAGSLRTASLKPALVNIEAENQGSWNYEVNDPRGEVARLCERRASLLGARRKPADADADLVESGRILLFRPHETLCDGAAFESSQGFFDKWNIPPWDTWIWYTRLPDDRVVLYSWVPPEFLRLAQQGVSANPEQCIRWLDLEALRDVQRIPEE
jgi:hypothetical protein